MQVLFAPVVDFRPSTTCIPDTGTTVTFSNLTSGKLDVETWAWSFGDPESGDANQSSAVTPKHRYGQSGTYEVTLTATAFNGCVSERSKELVFGDLVKADFTWKTDCYLTGQGITLYDRSVSGDVALDTLIWTFRNQGGVLLSQVGRSGDVDSIRYDFGNAGIYQVSLVAGAVEGCRDTVDQVLNLQPTIPVPANGFTEEFNSSPGGWVVGSADENASWVWGTPVFDGFEAGSGGFAFYTDLPAAAIGYEEQSWVQSPCYDFSDMSKPMISLDILRSFVPERDGAVLQYQDDRAEGWKTVGSLESGIEWYNVPDIVNEPGGSETGWGLEVFNPDTDWRYAAHHLKDIGGNPGVRFRIALGTQGSESMGNQGFAFDNITFKQRSRVALLEHFTNSSDASSRSADDLVDAFSIDNSENVIDLQYHMAYPGSDPMNQNNPLPAETRAFNYGIPNVPYAIMDGGFDSDYRFDFSGLKSTHGLEQALRLTLYPPEFEVTLDVNWEATGMQVDAGIRCNVSSYAENLQLYVVVFEKDVTAYTGGNGDTQFRNVVVDMLPTPAGSLIGNNWTYGQQASQSFSWSYASFVEDIDDLGVVAFVQDRATKKILQAEVVYKTPGVSVGRIHDRTAELLVYPNPASDHVFVNLGEPSEAKGRFQIVDVNGRLVLEEEVPAGYQLIRLDVQNLSRGFYFIHWFENGELKGRQKLVTVD
ncbi:MAG: PKD domain-containing protein [Bacteroidales bacterium]